jgi:hypothetical protein
MLITRMGVLELLGVICTVFHLLFISTLGIRLVFIFPTAVICLPPGGSLSSTLLALKSAVSIRLI